MRNRTASSEGIRSIDPSDRAKAYSDGCADLQQETSALVLIEQACRQLAGQAACGERRHEQAKRGWRAKLLFFNKCHADGGRAADGKVEHGDSGDQGSERDVTPDVS
jgi:hypothetical protein